MSPALSQFLDDYMQCPAEPLLRKEPERWKVLMKQDDYRQAKIQRLRREWYYRREELHAILRGLGCDRHLLNLTSTTRLPGCRRINDNWEPLGWQKLLYLNPVYPPIEPRMPL